MPHPRLPKRIAIGLLVAACGGSSGVVATPPPSDLASVPTASSGTPAPSSDAPAASPAPATALPTASPASLEPVVTPSETASASNGPTASPTAKPTAGPTPKPTPKPTPRPTPRPTTAPPTLSLQAKDFAFSPAALSVPAGAPFRIAFADRDADIPHNVMITSSAGASAFSGKIITGVSSIIYAVDALQAGEYRLGCIVHPEMTGSLTVR